MAVFPVNTTSIENGKEHPITADVVVEHHHGITSWFVARVIVWHGQVGGAMFDIYDGDVTAPRALRKMTPNELRSARERIFRRMLGTQYDDVIKRAWLMAKPAMLNEEAKSDALDA